MIEVTLYLESKRITNPTYPKNSFCYLHVIHSLNYFSVMLEYFLA